MIALQEQTRATNSRLDRLVLPSVVALALLLRLAYVAGLPAGQAFRTVDARGYRALAVSLLERGTYVLDEPSPSLLDAIRTPLYPTFLAGVLAVSGDAPRAVPLAHALVDTGTVVLVYALGRRLAGRRRGWLAALLYAVNPVSFLFIGEAFSEILLAFCLTLACLAFVAAVQARRRPAAWAALAGLASGLCVLDKPNIFALPLILAGSLLLGGRLSRRRLGKAGLLLGTALLVVLPWPVRNRAVYGEWFLSLAPEANLAHISAVATLAHVHGEAVAPWTPRWEQIYMEEVVAPAGQRYGWAEDTTLTAAEALRRRHDMASIAQGVIRGHPLAFVTAHARGVLRSFVPSLHRYWYGYLAGRDWPEVDSLAGVLRRGVGQARAGDGQGGLRLLGAWWQEQPPLARGLWLLSTAVHVLAYLLVAAGLWALRRRPPILIGLGLTLLLFLVLPGPIAYVRFWVPIMPVTCVLMACAGWKDESMKEWKDGRVEEWEAEGVEGGSASLPSFHSSNPPIPGRS
jgi:4-amino-4-deoxy-L-arabinose transferase-like glycosyltransferase